MVRNENTGKQAKGQKYVGKKKTKQKKKMAIMQPKDSYDQQQ